MISEDPIRDFQYASNRADVVLETVLETACDLQISNHSIERLKTRYGFVRLAAEHPTRASHNAYCILKIIESELEFDYPDVDEYAGKNLISEKIQENGLRFLGTLLQWENDKFCDTLRVLALATTRGDDPEIRARAASNLESAAMSADDVQYDGPPIGWRAAEMHIRDRIASETVSITEHNTPDRLIEEIIDHLIVALDDIDQYTRRKAIDAISRISNKFDHRREEVISILVNILYNDDTDVRQAAAEGIGIIARNRNAGYRDLTNKLYKALNDEEPQVRVSVIRALGEFNYRTTEWADDILPILLSVAANDDDSSVRKAAIEESKKYLAPETSDYPVLIYVPDEYYADIVRYFISILEEETDFFVLDATQKTLKELYEVALEMDDRVQETEDPPSELVLQGFLHAMQVNENGSVQFDIMHSLKQIVSDYPTDVREDIRQVTENIDLPLVDPFETQEIPLVAPETLTEHPSGEIQRKITRLIRTLEIDGEEQHANGPREDSVRLLRSITNEAPEIIDDLIATLLTARRRDDKGNRVLAAGLQGNAKVVIRRAISGSDDVSGSLVESVYTALNHPDQFVRSSAVELLGDAFEYAPDHDDEIVEALIDAYVSDDEYTIRGSAIESMGTVLIKSPNSRDNILETIFTAVEDSHESVRREAVRTLREVAIDSDRDRDSILNHLATCLSDNDKLVRSRSMSAIEELSEMNPKNIVTYSEPVIDVLVDRDENPAVRSDAVRVFSRIGLCPETLEGLEDKSDELQRCASEEVFSPTVYTRLVDISSKLPSNASF